MIFVICDFQDGGSRHLKFSKNQNFNNQSAVGGQCASPCQISSKSVTQLQRYDNLTVFSTWRPSAILDLLGAYWDHSRWPLSGPKGTPMRESASFEPSSVKIRPWVWPVGEFPKKRYNGLNQRQPSCTPSWIFKIAQGCQVHTTLDLITCTPKMFNQQRKKLYQRLKGYPLGCRTMLWRCHCQCSRPDRQTGAYCVWSVSECVRRPSDELRRRTHVSGGQFTPPHQTRQDCRACQSTAAAATQARQAATPSGRTAHTQRRCMPRNM